MTRREWFALASLLASGATAQDGGIGKRRAELERLLSRLPKLEPFEKWLRETGELPPDFDALPSMFHLPDPLSWQAGGQVSRAGWPKRRHELVQLAEQWLVGTAPPPPDNVVGDIVETTSLEGREVWKVQLRFGPGHAAKLSVTLLLPSDVSKRSPIFLADGDRYRPWALGAMAEGFGFCFHAAADRNDESWAYANLFGKYDWSSFRRRGWSASRVVDWLLTLPFVDNDRIFIGGHSRSAKQAITGAAFDDRIAGVIASSPGSGGSMPYRYCDQSFFGESAEVLTRLFPDWVHLRVRFFAGREHKLPADSHFLYALLAPRPLMMSTATEDTVEGTWTVEQHYKILKRVYSLLGAESNLAFRYRPGGHATDQATAAAFSEFLLASAGQRDRRPAELFPFTPFHVWDYEEWARSHPPRPAPGRSARSSQPRDVLRRVEWLLGEGPAYTRSQVQFGIGETEEEERELGRLSVKAPRKIKMRFGQNVNGYVFAPNAAGKLPCVIWLPPFHVAKGFIPAGYRTAEPTVRTLVPSGFAVVAFDHLGIGGRQRERRTFYETHPSWSLLGKMVLDARHAVDAALASPWVDPQRIYLYGYALGGLVATIAAAFDKRVAGLVTVAGFTPLRTNLEEKGTGGLRRLSHLHGWIPRLGWFIGRESEAPADFDEILSVIAPRPALVIAPQLDRYAVLADVERAVAKARESYAAQGAPEALQLETPYDENRLTDAMQNEAIARLKQWSGVRG